MSPSPDSIRSNASCMPDLIPKGHIGAVVLPGSNRTVWWTGRVAIGLRYERQTLGAMNRSAEWLQSLLVDGSAGRARS